MIKNERIGPSTPQPPRPVGRRLGTERRPNGRSFSTRANRFPEPLLKRHTKWLAGRPPCYTHMYADIYICTNTTTSSIALTFSLAIFTIAPRLGSGERSNEWRKAWVCGALRSTVTRFRSEEVKGETVCVRVEFEVSVCLCIFLHVCIRRDREWGREGKQSAVANGGCNGGRKAKRSAATRTRTAKEKWRGHGPLRMFLFVMVAEASDQSAGGGCGRTPWPEPPLLKKNNQREASRTPTAGLRSGTESLQPKIRR